MEGFEDRFIIAFGIPIAPKVGERTIVIGGGNVAIDASRTALRLGAKEVHIVYRRSRDEMPANSWEIEAAEKEGIKLQLLTAPVEAVVEDGHVRGVKCLKMELGEPDASGRRRPIPIKDSEFVIPADTMIAAVAQAPEISFLEETHGLEVTPKGYICYRLPYISHKPTWSLCRRRCGKGTLDIDPGHCRWPKRSPLHRSLSERCSASHSKRADSPSCG